MTHNKTGSNDSENDEWRFKMFEQYSNYFISIAESRKLGTKFVDFVKLAASYGEGKSALDLGCGTGRAIEKLLEKFQTITALDNSAKLLEFAEFRVTKLKDGNRVRFINCDMREISSNISGQPFDFIQRIYTSLGYFSFETERAILEKCHSISQSGATIILDTFNLKWLREIRSFRREISFHNFILHESYQLSDNDKFIDCIWTYEIKNADAINIDFRLEAYGFEQIEQLLFAAGWNLIGCWSDYDPDAKVGRESSCERLIALARR